MDTKKECDHRDCQAAERCLFLVERTTIKQEPGFALYPENARRTMEIVRQQKIEREKKLNPPDGCYFADPTTNNRGERRAPKARCQWKDCSAFTHTKFNYKVDKYAVNIYCNTHLEQCKNYGCKNRNVSYQSVFCDDHRCIIDKCIRAKLRDNYCIDHQCRAVDCGELRCINHVYCVDHSCPKEGCSRCKLKEHEICVNHYCAFCVARLTTNKKTFYCNNHWCYMDNCAYIRLQVNNRKTLYCNLHTCCQPECEFPITIPGMRFCDQHLCPIAKCGGLRIPEKSCCAYRPCLNRSISTLLSIFRVGFKQKNLIVPKDIKVLLIGLIEKFAEQYHD